MAGVLSVKLAGTFHMYAFECLYHATFNAKACGGELGV